MLQQLTGKNDYRDNIIQEAKKSNTILVTYLMELNNGFKNLFQKSGATFINQFKLLVYLLTGQIIKVQNRIDRVELILSRISLSLFVNIALVSESMSISPTGLPLFIMGITISDWVSGLQAKYLLSLLTSETIMVFFCLAAAPQIPLSKVIRV